MSRWEDEQMSKAFREEGVEQNTGRVRVMLIGDAGTLDSPGISCLWRTGLDVRILLSRRCRAIGTDTWVRTEQSRAEKDEKSRDEKGREQNRTDEAMSIVQARARARAAPAHSHSKNDNSDHRARGIKSRFSHLHLCPSYESHSESQEDKHADDIGEVGHPPIV